MAHTKYEPTWCLYAKTGANLYAKTRAMSHWMSRVPPPGRRNTCGLEQRRKKQHMTHDAGFEPEQNRLFVDDDSRERNLRKRGGYIVSLHIGGMGLAVLVVATTVALRWLRARSRGCNSVFLGVCLVYSHASASRTTSIALAPRSKSCRAEAPSVSLNTRRGNILLSCQFPPGTAATTWEGRGWGGVSWC
jgi:hypothetical protein